MLRTTPTRTTAVALPLLALALGGCAAGHVNPADRDTSGAYDGVWIAEVGGPRAKREPLPNNWYMTCDWEPYELTFVVDDGRIQLGRLEERTPVSKDGDFRIDVAEGGGRMSNGTMPGNGKFVNIFSGNLAGEAPRGRYAQQLAQLGANGCNAPIRLRRQSESAA